MFQEMAVYCFSSPWYSRFSDASAKALPCCDTRFSASSTLGVHPLPWRRFVSPWWLSVVRTSYADKIARRWMDGCLKGGDCTTQEKTGGGVNMLSDWKVV